MMYSYWRRLILCIHKMFPYLKEKPSIYANLVYERIMYELKNIVKSYQISKKKYLNKENIFLTYSKKIENSIFQLGPDGRHGTLFQWSMCKKAKQEMSCMVQKICNIKNKYAKCLNDLKIHVYAEHGILVYDTPIEEMTEEYLSKIDCIWYR